MEILLIRHGEAEASWGVAADPGLSELGRREAQQAAQRIRPMLAADALLISSPLLRARQTAEPLARLTGLPVQIDPVFREIPSLVPLAQRQAWLRQFMQAQWSQQAHNLLEWRTAILERLMVLQQPAVVFTHFLVINAVVGHVWQRETTLCCWPANGSVTRLRRNADGLEVLVLGREMPTTVN